MAIRLAGRLFRRINWFSVLIPIVFGCPFLYIGLSEVYKTAQTVNASATAQGTVVDNVWQAFAHGGASYVPVVEFQTDDGEVVRFTDGIGTFPPEYEVGAEVSVLYDPENVHSARISTWKRIWFAPTLITGIGMLPVAVGIGLGWLMRQRGSG